MGNVLAVDRIAFRIAPLFQEPEFANIHQCAARLADSARATLPYWAPFCPQAQLLVGSVTERGLTNPDPTDDLSCWVATFIVLPALQRHLVALPRVDGPHEKAALAFADEVLRVAHDDHLRYRVVIPLSGIDIVAADGGAFVQGDISIHQLSEAEQGRWLEGSRELSPAFSLVADVPQVVVELAVAGPRTGQHMTSDDLVAPLLAAFQLHGYLVGGRLATEKSDPDWVLPMTSNMPLTLPARSKGVSSLTQDDFHIVVTTADQLGRYHVRRPRSPKDLALHRFVGGLARENAADTVVDFTIALEALLLPYDEATRRGDLGYRFRMHGAHYLSDGVDQRATVARQLRAIYEMRSRLVHGGPVPRSATDCRRR